MKVEENIKSYLSLVVDGVYSGSIAPHENTFHLKQWCSKDQAFCVTHGNGNYDDVIIKFNGYEYFHSQPDIFQVYGDIFHYYMEFWDCVVW